MAGACYEKPAPFQSLQKASHSISALHCLINPGTAPLQPALSSEESTGAAFLFEQTSKEALLPPLPPRAEADTCGTQHSPRHHQPCTLQFPPGLLMIPGEEG